MQRASEPLISVVVPTTGRRTLVRTLASIHQQLPKHSKLTLEVLVVGDTTDGPVPFAELVVRHYEEKMPVRYLTADGGHCWGNPARNYAMHQATGHWLSFMDDDDIYARGAFIAIYDGIMNQAIDKPRPMIFNMIAPDGETVPGDHRSIEQGHVGTPCIVTPMVPGLLGRWGDRYEGDYDFIRSTMELWTGEPDWQTATIAICRPPIDADWTKAS